MPIFLLVFVVVPLLEIALFIKVGGVLGVGPTVALVVVTAVAGVALLRWQGLATLMRARERMATGEMPAREMAEGIMLAVAGAVLLTPGFFTDAVGFALLVPVFRHWLFNRLKHRFVMHQVGSGGFYQRPGSDAGGHTFDGEYRREDDPERERDRISDKK